MWGSGDLGRSRLSLDCVHWADKTPTADARSSKHQPQAPVELGYFHLRGNKRERDGEAVRLLNEMPVEARQTCPAEMTLFGVLLF